MKFKDKIVDGIGILSLKGKLMGIPETDELHTEIKSMLGQNIKKIILDLHGVTWMNSLGIGSIMRCLTTVRNAGGDIALARMSEKTRNVFMITQLVSVFKIHKTIEDALETIK